MKKLTDEQRHEILEKYKTGKFTAVELGIEYNVSGANIGLILKKNKIQINNNQSKLQRKYSINENFFDCVDTEGKAYFLGFLYADGCNYTETNHVFIGLQARDIDILKKMNILIESDRPIQISNPSGFGCQDVATLHINNKRISKKLIDLGCTKAKSLTLQFPTEDQVPSHLIRHFMRGYFDGDGSVGNYLGTNNKLYMKFNVVSTVDFCKGIQNIFIKYFNMHYNVVSKGKYHNVKTGQISTSRTINSYKIMSWMYRNSTIFLKRKYDIFQEGSELLDIDIRKTTDIMISKLI